MCVSQLDSNGLNAEMDEDTRTDLVDKKVFEIGQKGEKPLAMGFRDYSVEEFD